MLSLLLSHLSDYSYIERGFHDILILAWMLHRLKQNDFWSTLTWQSIRRVQLKPYATLLTLISIITFIIYDIICTKFKYEEGFVVNANGNIVTKSKTLYSDYNRQLVLVSDSLLMFLGL